MPHMLSFCDRLWSQPSYFEVTRMSDGWQGVACALKIDNMTGSNVMGKYVENAKDYSTYRDATRNLEWENCEEEAKKKQQQRVTRVTFFSWVGLRLDVTTNTTQVYTWHNNNGWERGSSNYKSIFLEIVAGTLWDFICVISKYVSSASMCELSWHSVHFFAGSRWVHFIQQLHQMKFTENITISSSRNWKLLVVWMTQFVILGMHCARV